MTLSRASIIFEGIVTILSCPYIAKNYYLLGFSLFQGLCCEMFSHILCEVSSIYDFILNYMSYYFDKLYVL